MSFLFYSSDLAFLIRIPKEPRCHKFVFGPCFKRSRDVFFSLFESSAVTAAIFASNTPKVAHSPRVFHESPLDLLARFPSRGCSRVHYKLVSSFLAAATIAFHSVGPSRCVDVVFLAATAELTLLRALFFSQLLLAFHPAPSLLIFHPRASSFPCTERKRIPG